MVCNLAPIVFVEGQDFPELLVVGQFFYVVKVIVINEGQKFFSFFARQCLHGFAPFLCISQVFKEIAKQQECFGHDQQFHELVLVLAKGFFKERFSFPYFPFGRIQDDLYGSDILFVPMGAYKVPVVAMFSGYWMVLHGKRIDIHLHFFAQVHIDAHPVIQVCRLVLVVVEQIV